MMKAIFNKINAIIALPIFGVAASLAVYTYNQHEEEHKKKVTTIEEKLKLFYYPLQAQLAASNNEWKAFRSKFGVGRKSYFASGPIVINGKTRFLRDCAPGEDWVIDKRCIVSDTEIEAWVTHISAQFHGSRGKVEDIILNNRMLIKDDKEVIDGVDLLMLHITGYRDVVKRWETGDRSVMVSHVNFPGRLTQVIDNRIEKLEEELKSLK
ncbi:MAG: hypothetical protein ACM3Q1_01270 [Bacteroidales bacterium]